jgi:hypothetical protein
MSTPTTVVDVDLPSGGTVAVRAVQLGGAQDVGFGALTFSGVTDSIEEIARSVYGAIEKVAPKKASVTFGVEVAVKSGKLVSLLAQADGTATLTVTLEWGG